MKNKIQKKKEILIRTMMSILCNNDNKNNKLKAFYLKK